jgi:hypothetical protein
LPAEHFVGAEARAVAVPALPDIDPVIVLLNVLVPLHVFVLAKRVDDAAVIVCVSPKLNNVPFTVIEEFWRAELGRSREEEAID